MKCISLWQPWASLCVIGAKRHETRSWATSHRGPLLIHAAKKWDGELRVMYFREPFLSVFSRDGLMRRTGPDTSVMDYMPPLGCIIGVVELVECYRAERSHPMDRLKLHSCTSRWGWEELPDGNEYEFGDFSVGRYAWKLTNPRRFATPIPFHGQQQLFDVPDEVVAEQMGAVAL